ncbi:MAG: KilA-N domain-containing protein [Clostridia bacterium]|nr:KilA-N domain-containing protein [Clostridia bacterium]
MEKKIYKETLNVNNLQISIMSNDNENDFISLTDLARYKNPEFPKDVVKNWMRNRSTIEFLGLWEMMHNPNFKGVDFDTFVSEAGSNSFVMTPQKWIESTNAIGIVSRSGNGGGTFAHKDIAFEFASWLSPEFKLYVITDYQRLKNDESNRLSTEWNIKRLVAKTNYKLHTDAIKQNLIPENVSSKHQSITYANEADMLNVALFGMTAKEWKDKNPNAKGNIRDNATISQLIVLANIENLNATFIKAGLSQQERLIRLNQEAIYQLTTFKNNSSIKKIEKMNNNKTPLLPGANKK